MLFSKKTALWLAILPSALAADCTASTAIVIDPSSGSAAAVEAIKGRNLNVRATLVCTSTETCVTAEGLLACVDVSTGDFHDATGGTGNLITGEYTAANGQETTFALNETPTPTAGTSDSTAASQSKSASKSASPSTSAPPLPSTSDTDTATETDTNAPVIGTPTTGASGSKTSAVATHSKTSTTATPTSGADRLSGRGAVVGALGLLVGILAN